MYKAHIKNRNRASFALRNFETQKCITPNAKLRTILHNNSISPIANLRQNWRGFDLLWILHNKEGVKRAGEAGE